LLEEITLKFTEAGDLTLDCSVTTIFVGPNNAGKSLLLRELQATLNAPGFPHDLKLLKDYTFTWPTPGNLDSTLEKFTAPNNLGLPPDRIVLRKVDPGGTVDQVELTRTVVVDIVSQKTNKQWFAAHVVRFGVIRLDGRSRFVLTDDQQGGDLLAPPTNVLSHLFANDAARKKAREIVKDAFGVYLTIDPTYVGNLRIKLSTVAPPSDEQSLNQQARDFHRAALHIKDASDGVQAFTGIVAAVLSGEFHTILVDEPEAFLHPPLARKLGRHLTRIAANRGGTLMAATHSADFLMGCVEAGKPVQVVRLEHQNGKSNGRLVDAAKLSQFFRSPLMRSANVIGGLFHDGVVVTESDNDRAFYAEVYHRLAAENEDYPAILFVNAQNKQTMRDIVGPLREFGIPAAAIADIDLVKDGGKVWGSWMDACQIPSALHAGLGQNRASIKQALNDSGKDMNRDGGIEILGVADKTAAQHFFDQLDKFGLFAVRRGELESWLPSLGVSGKKTDWTVAMLQALGDDPAKTEYIKPANGDVWDFMRAIVAWIQDPGRAGT
jgi:hypothetical protein